MALKWTSWFKLPWAAQAIRFPASNVDIGVGGGSPTGTVLAYPGSEYRRTDPTGPATARYRKYTGANTNTGWMPDVVMHEEANLQTISQGGALVMTEGQSAFAVASTGGAVTAVTMPVGTVAGQVVLIYGTSATATVQFADNAGNLKLGAATRTLALNDVLQLYWNGSAWLEVSFIANG